MPEVWQILPIIMKKLSTTSGKMPGAKILVKKDDNWQKLPIFCQFSSLLEHFQFRGTFGKKLAIIANFLSMGI